MEIEGLGDKVVDHTIGNGEGHFVYFSMNGLAVNSTARLLSPFQKKTASACVHFYYTTLGINHRHLSIFENI